MYRNVYVHNFRGFWKHITIGNISFCFFNNYLVQNDYMILPIVIFEDFYKMQFEGEKKVYFA